jgi:rod shape-determining protein MreC
MLSSDSLLVEGIRTAALESFGVVGEGFNSVLSYFNLSETNRQLRKRNAELAYENSQLQDALMENLRLRKLLQFKYEVEYNLIPATVIGEAPHDFVTGLLLSCEDLDKVQKNSAVMTAEGLVGRIVKISPNYAICQLLNDPNSRVSVRIQRNRELGIVRWGENDRLNLDHIPMTVVVEPGDVLFTSGMSQIYPPDIKVGVVTGIEKNDQELLTRITVRPSVNFNRLEEVFILESIESNASRD